MFKVGNFYTTEDLTFIYECIQRGNGWVRFESRWQHGKATTPMLKIYKDEDEEYVVLNTFHGREHRLYAR